MAEQRRGAPRGRVDPARRAAYDVLRAVDEDDAYVNLVLPPLLRDRGIAGRDAAFATELTHGTVRRSGTYDLILDHLAPKGIDAPVRDVLRLGTHQLLGMRVPSHAAISTSVDLVRTAVGHRPAGFVNAVLRKVDRLDEAAWVDRVAPPAEQDPIGRLSVEHAHPRWVVEALRDALAAGPTDGDALDDLAALLSADNEPPRVTLVARPGLADVGELGVAGAEPGHWSPYAVRLTEGGDPAAIDAVRDGRAGVQDEGSQLVALAATSAALDGPDARWLDLCAGPGGKAALTAALAAPRGAHLVANEVAPHRARLVAAAVRRLPDVEVVTHDGRTLELPPFDRVLVDAPCTGLGALRRRPEARWRRRPEDVGELVRLQRALLVRAVELTRPGGVVTYATCSPHLAETRGVVEDVLAGREDVTLLDATAALPQVPDLAGTGPYVQLWPHRHGTDAMFVAQLRRR
ncbi:UNVERIFIED_CONTAM: rRNA cytosine-C5-methyltransferase [Mumia flava]|uniref:RsmB/NOP family class I SAM-dependent RNA methyltransferase n=1 Tax=Mumia flava TaxID=1348852 RepID=UPI0005753C13|nr:transcription antitermination factor NusB [Mumia flava]